jgi:hypothetical protein
MLQVGGGSADELWAAAAARLAQISTSGDTVMCANDEV